MKLRFLVSSLKTKKCASALLAICGRCVMLITCTFFWHLPQQAGHLSSYLARNAGIYFIKKITVETNPAPAIIHLMASINLESSPPEATLSISASAMPLLAENKKTYLAHPRFRHIYGDGTINLETPVRQFQAASTRWKPTAQRFRSGKPLLMNIGSKRLEHT